MLTLQDDFTELENDDEDLFVTPLDDDAEPTETQLQALEVVERFLPVESTFNFKCVRCGGFHDMFKTKSDGNGSFICPKTGRVI